MDGALTQTTSVDVKIKVEVKTGVLPHDDVVQITRGTLV